ncbi:hypothetical protein V6R21_26555 [Limibacter armeniacum]|uniref:DUF7691 family protein n=1 Tax=Limibacter armeniacum TaxID=466084 RepID=UPI002FE5DEC3
MSYGITPYRVNLSRVRSRLDKDCPSSKKSKAKKACLNQLSRCGFGTEDGEPTDAELINAFIADGKAEHEGLGYKYWYALEGLIGDLGQFLSNGYWYPGTSDPFFNTDGFKLYDIGGGIDIPTPDDFPAVFVLENSDMSEELIQEFEKKYANELEAETIKQFKSWITQAQRYKQDLVLYYY